MTERTVRLLTTNDESLTDAALAVLRELPGLGIEVFYCSPSAAAWVECPLIKDESGRSFFGIEGIRDFVEQRKAG